MSRITASIFLVAVMFASTALGQPSARTAALKAHADKLIYPVYKGAIEMGVMPVTPTYAFMHKGKCKIAFDMSESTPDSARNELNTGILEIMRTINLHVAAGVKKEDIEAVVVFHGPAAASFMNNEMYNKRFKMNNPNLALIKSLNDNGVKMVICGQTLALRDMTLDAFPAGIMKSYSAVTAISDLQQRNFKVYSIAGE